MPFSFRYDARVTCDKGWLRSPVSGAWELRDSRGQILRSVPAAYVDQGGAGLVNMAGAQKLWPPLRPGQPHMRCVLTGGPAGSVYAYLEPGEDVPEVLAVRGQVYRLAVHCGHLTCPYHYAAAEHTG